jgi:hypothetical protein
MIQDVESLDPELELGVFANVEPPVDSQIQIELPGRSHRVPAERSYSGRQHEGTVGAGPCE